MLERAIFILAVVPTALACSTSPAASSDAGPRDGGTSDPPYLTALDVSSSDDASPGLTLVPAFSPHVHDYYVRCASGVNALTVSMTASRGASTVMMEPTTAAPSPQQTLSVNANENQAIVVAATAGNAAVQYWVRCLPHDFPQMTMKLHEEAGAPPPGYYLLATSQLPPMANWSYAIVMDGNGVPVWYAHGPVGAGIDDVDALVGGAISYLPNDNRPPEILHLAPPAPPFRSPPASEHDTHELRVLPNGDYLIISSPVEPGVDLTGIHLRLLDGGVEDFGPSSNAVACNIVEFDPKTGDVKWNWVGTDHFVPRLDTTGPEFDRPPLPDGGKVVDTFHCNSIDVDPANDNLLVSSRDMDSIFYIEKATGKVLWKMGGKSYTTDHATYVPNADPFHRQHDARLQPGWSSTCAGGTGQISLFDDEAYEPRPARALLLDVVVGSGDGGAKEDCGAKGGGTPGATVAWQYTGAASSNVMGSFRISPDGSRVIGWGASPVAGPVFTEVDSKGADLLDFYFAGNSVSYRVVKVPLSTLDLNVLRRTAVLP
jgi:hypothetical protein